MLCLGSPRCPCPSADILPALALPSLGTSPGSAGCATDWGQGPLAMPVRLAMPRRAGAAGTLPAPRRGYTHHAKSTQAYMMAAPRTATVVSSVCSSSCRTPGKQTVRFCPL